MVLNGDTSIGRIVSTIGSGDVGRWGVGDTGHAVGMPHGRGEHGAERAQGVQGPPGWVPALLFGRVARRPGARRLPPDSPCAPGVGKGRRRRTPSAAFLHPRPLPGGERAPRCRFSGREPGTSARYRAPGHGAGTKGGQRRRGRRFYSDIGRLGRGPSYRNPEISVPDPGHGPRSRLRKVWAPATAAAAATHGNKRPAATRPALCCSPVQRRRM
jgi:hypothetical protein